MDNTLVSYFFLVQTSFLSFWKLILKLFITRIGVTGCNPFGYVFGDYAFFSKKTHFSKPMFLEKLYTWRIFTRKRMPSGHFFFFHSCAILYQVFCNTGYDYKSIIGRLGSATGLNDLKNF